MNIVNYHAFASNTLKEQYAQAEEFPHIVLDNFLDKEAAGQILKAFPALGSEGWIHYMHVNEKKYGLNKWEVFPPFIREVIKILNGDEFVSFLREVTGIPNLIPDPGLEGGGIHQIPPGGFLNIHADFTAHPHHRNWSRRVNVLIYFNDEWEDSYGGHLELWARDMSRCFRKVLPLFNRCVIFNTDKDSYHGHPHPLTCPEGRTRKSIALYYFTEEEVAPLKRATNYQPLPEDTLVKRILIFLDKKVLVLYNWLKGKLGINDDAISRVLKLFSSKKK